MKKTPKKTSKKSSQKDVDKLSLEMTSDGFDSMMKAILQVHPEPKKKTISQKNS